MQPANYLQAHFQPSDGRTPSSDAACFRPIVTRERLLQLEKILERSIARRLEAAAAPCGGMVPIRGRGELQVVPVGRGFAIGRRR